MRPYDSEGIMWFAMPLFSSKNVYPDDMQDVIHGFTKNLTEVVGLCSRIYLDIQIPNRDIDRQVKKRVKSLR